MKASKIHTRVTAEDIQYLKYEAASRGMSLSDFLRMLIDEGLVRRKMETLDRLKRGRPRKNT